MGLLSHLYKKVVKSKDAEMASTVQRKETQIIEFLKAVEMKTAQKDQVTNNSSTRCPAALSAPLRSVSILMHFAFLSRQELADTRQRLERTETALSKLMQEFQGNGSP